jgi:hypothetical protein
MVGGKLGQVMVEIIWETFGPDYKKVTEQVKDGLVVALSLNERRLLPLPSCTDDVLRIYSFTESFQCCI